MAGTAAANSTKQLDEIWADAMARFPEETDAILFAINVARVMSQSRWS